MNPAVLAEPAEFAYNLPRQRYSRGSQGELCGCHSLQSHRRDSILSLASSSDRNQFTFRRSSLKLPLNDPMQTLSTGLPGRLKSSSTPFRYAATCLAPSR